MKKTIYKGYIIDSDNLGRAYIYNTASPYSEENDHIVVCIADSEALRTCKQRIDEEIWKKENKR